MDFREGKGRKVQSEKVDEAIHHDLCALQEME